MENDILIEVPSSPLVSLMTKENDTQLIELRLTENEKKALEMDQRGSSLREIAEQLFHDEITRQAVYEMVKRAERKVWMLGARERYAKRPGSCPTDEIPLPSRVRHSLKTAGYTRLGQLAGLNKTELSSITGLGRHGAFLVYALMQKWGVRKAAAYCPNCGASLASSKLKKVRCDTCGLAATVTVETKPQLVHA